MRIEQFYMSLQIPSNLMLHNTLFFLLKRFIFENRKTNISIPKKVDQ